MNEESNTARACAFLARVGAARSAQIAEAIGVAAKQLVSILGTPVERGYLVVCKIERPGRRDENEYRISTAGQGMSWTQYRESIRSETKAVATKKESGSPWRRQKIRDIGNPPPPASAPPADQAQVSATTVPASAEAVAPSRNPPAEASETPVPAAVPAAPAREDSHQVEFSLCSNGRFSILGHDGAEKVVLQASETKRLREFLGCFA